MLKLEFQNAVVEDNGYGLKVNGNSLEEVISTALGTKIGNRSGYGSGLPNFKSNCCNVTVIIDPKPVTTNIETNEEVWSSVEEMEEDKREQFEEKTEKTDPEE